jgi:uncharacterized protein YndB with AHSA1/START domain
VQHIEVVRRIAGPPEAVFSVYTDHAAWADWGGVGTARIEREGDPPPNGSGCVRVLGPGRFAAWEEILDFVPGKRMTYRIVKGGLPIRDHFGEVLFEPDGADGGGTRIVWRCRFESRIPGLGPLFRAGVARLFRGVLDGMAKQNFPERA